GWKNQEAPPLQSPSPSTDHEGLRLLFQRECREDLRRLLLRQQRRRLSARWHLGCQCSYLCLRSAALHPEGAPHQGRLVQEPRRPCAVHRHRRQSIASLLEARRHELPATEEEEGGSVLRFREVRRRRPLGLVLARYGSGPEPIDNFYVVVMVNAEFGLLLGDMSKEHIRRFGGTIPTAEFSMISRKEQVLGHSRHSTTSRFRDAGRDHEITVRCKGDGCDARDSELSVCIDRKRVVQVRKLRWNFRGNQTVFVEGSPVDVMWDVHDWWFGNPSGCAMFMFRTRSSPESRPWSSSEEMSGFSLVIQAFRSP
ncbi:unnamed protein product, partial [Musa textilis]